MTLFDAFNFSVKYWPNHRDFSMGKIVFAERRYVWYVHVFKFEIAYEQFRN